MKTQPRVKTRIDIINLVNDLKIKDRTYDSVVTATIDNEKFSSTTISESKLSYIIDSFNEIKSAKDQVSNTLHTTTNINGKQVKPPVFDVSGRHPIDSFIEQDLGARRVGYTICWTLSDGTYVYDPFQQKLERRDDASN